MRNSCLLAFFYLQIYTNKFSLYAIDWFYVRMKSAGASSSNLPMVGPQHPAKARQQNMNTFSGRVDEDGTNTHMFEEQRRSFEATGVSYDPSGQYVVQKQWSGYGRSDKKRKRDGEEETVQEEPKEIVDAVDWRKGKAKKEAGAERDPRLDPANVSSFLGSWADTSTRKRAPTREEEEEARKQREEEEKANPSSTTGDNSAQGRKKAKLEEQSEWHVKDEERKRDSDGSTWLRAPRGAEQAANARIEVRDSQIDRDVMKLLMANNVDDGEGEVDRSAAASRALEITQKFSSGVQNFLPKKIVHKWGDAQKALSACRFFPRYGHLIFAASMDSNVRVYETGFYDHGKKRRCLMTYKGHEQSIREMDISPDGSRLLTASYDNFVRLWDAETGATIGKFSEKGGRSSAPYCCKFYPLDGAQMFLVGQSNRKVVQWDSRSNEIVQEYNGHLGAINSITFIDENRRFITSSDDKSIRVWNYEIPVDIKYIADPKMHSMPCITAHPNGKWFLCQGLDNKIHVYSTREKFPANHKKKFSGHLVSGYACNLSVSPDGRIVSCGDSSGQLFFWDWKTCKLLKKVKAHSKTAIDVQWHPLRTSTLASAGWDNQLFLWD